ncbi:hypothetical protein Trydic_g12344 [Trypoxylus dichotomus]
MQERQNNDSYGQPATVASPPSPATGEALEELSAVLEVDRSTVGKRLHALGLGSKAGNWVPYELKERDIKRRLVTCEMLLQRQERTNFLHPKRQVAASNGAM